MMKKFLLGALVAMMAVGLTACGESEDMENMEENMEQQQQDTTGQDDGMGSGDDTYSQDDGMDSGDGFGEDSGMEGED